MSPSLRRSFVKSMLTASGVLFAPRWLARAHAHFEGEGTPLIEVPTRVMAVLYAEPSDSDPSEYILTLDGRRHDPPPPKTWRQFIADTSGPVPRSAKQLMDEWGIEPEQLEKEVDEEQYLDYWSLQECPEVQAYYFLDRITSKLRNASPQAHPLGGLSFYDCPTIGSTYRAVHADSPFSLSCLQRTLNALRKNVEVRIVS